MITFARVTLGVVPIGLNFALLTSPIITGCGNTLSPPSPQKIPMVEGLLVAGASTATIRISWPATTTEGGSVRIPALDREVDLSLGTLDDLGGLLVPVIDSPGYFRASLPVQ